MPEVNLPARHQEACSPVELTPAGSKHPIDRPEQGIALCLSGGGYRAMLFHAGALWRLNEVGYLRKLARISSVSGGSITAAQLGVRWNKLEFGLNSGVAGAFGTEVIDPIRRLASRTIDRGAVLGGVFLPGSISDKVTGAYREHLYGNATLQDLPDDPPRFIINATNVQSGALWRFSKPYMRDYRVGEIKNPEVELAVAVAASSAFPPILSPLRLEVDASRYEQPTQEEDLHFEPYLSDVVLSDGGVYDNLGLETAWKRYTTVLVSDGGGKMQPDADPKDDWARHALRVNEIIDNQVRSLRKRQVIDSFQRKTREGTYWGIRTDIAHYAAPGALPCPHPQTLALAATPTRLARLDEVHQERLINWGYAVCDAALRRHVDRALPPPAGFPYPASGVG
jgi:NTE family protein